MWKVYFNLTKPSQLEVSSEINGIKLGVSQGSDQLVAELVEACDESNAQQRAFTAANQFLDALWKCNSYLGIDPNSQHTEYISPSGQKHTSITGSCAIGGSTGSMKMVKKDSSGNIPEVYDSSRPGRIEIKPSVAASFFRRAQLSHHPFEKFRELYRAAENIASKIKDVKGLSKNELKRLSESGQSFEEGLLKLALGECFGSNPRPLKQIAGKLPEFDEAKDTIPQVAKILYNGYRCQLNHSKALEDKKIPFNPQDVKEVKAALPLMEFVAKSLLQYEETSLL